MSGGKPPFPGIQILVFAEEGKGFPVNQTGIFDAASYRESGIFKSEPVRIPLVAGVLKDK